MRMTRCVILRPPWIALCTISSLFWQKVDERDCHLEGKPSYYSGNSFWRVFVSFQNPDWKVLRSKSGVLTKWCRALFHSLGFISWMISLNRVSCHRQISWLKVVLPQVKYIWGPKLRWADLIRRKDGSTVDSFQETLEVYIILDPNNVDSSISSKKNVYQQFLFPNQRIYFHLAILNLQQWKLICAFRKTVTSACGRWLGRKDLCTFTAVAPDVVVFSSI